MNDRTPKSDAVAPPAGYLARWRRPGHTAWLYLLHAALLTSSLAITSLLFNLAILALGYPRSFLGVLNMLSLAVAGALSLPLWWLVSYPSVERLSFRGGTPAGTRLSTGVSFPCSRGSLYRLIAALRSRSWVA